jgi:glycosyltransferase involved in cell wall biosynthesis
MSDRGDRPVLFLTGHMPPDRVGAFAALHERERIEVALFGGRLRHGSAGRVADLPFPHRFISQRGALALAGGGHYRAVIASLGGRLALPAGWAGARGSRTPLILWSALWHHPRTAAHLLSRPALWRLYRSADAIVTYGPHVSAYVRAKGARNVHEAPQAVDNDFWSAAVERSPADPRWPANSELNFLFVGRLEPEKGVKVLLSAWRLLELHPRSAALVLVGSGSLCAAVRKAAVGEHLSPSPDDGANAGAVVALGRASAQELRNFYRAADVLVLPSIPTRTFREPWGLVVNEAFNQQLPVIATDAVGAVAGGLVRDRRNGLVVPAGDARALAQAMRTLALDPRLRARLGAAARADVRPYTYDAWAAGFSSALASLGRSLQEQRAAGSVA